MKKPAFLFACTFMLLGLFANALAHKNSGVLVGVFEGNQTRHQQDI